MSDYADSSFLVSLYVLDTNSSQAAAIMKRANLPLLLNSFGETELINAISLRQFRGEISSSGARTALSLLREDLQRNVLVIKPITTAAFEAANRLARNRTPALGTRTIDILHVASALTLQCQVFRTFDNRQRQLVRAEGLPLL